MLGRDVMLRPEKFKRWQKNPKEFGWIGPEENITWGKEGREWEEEGGDEN